MLVSDKEGDVKDRIKELHFDKTVPKTRTQVVVRHETNALVSGYVNYSPPPPSTYDKMQKSEFYSTDRPVPKEDAVKLTGILNKLFAEAVRKKERTRVFCPGQDPSLVNLPHENPVINLGAKTYDLQIYLLERKWDVRQMYKKGRR